MAYKFNETRDIRLTLLEISRCCVVLIMVEKDYRDNDMPIMADQIRTLLHSLLNVTNRAYDLPLYDDCDEVEVKNNDAEA